jgi:hypothetical protein
MTPEWSVPPTFLEEQVEFSHSSQFKRTVQMRRLLQIQMGVNYARLLKVIKAERF